MKLELDCIGCYAKRMKERISCFDIDGTLSEGLLFVPLIKSEHESELLSDDAFAQINELLVAYKSGDLEYEDAVERLLRVHARGLRGEKRQELKQHAKKFLLAHEKELFHKFGREAIQMLKGEHRLFVVTAEPQYLAEAVADMYGIRGYISSIYAENDGKLSGNIERSLAHRSAKASLIQEYDIEFAFGDSEGDIDMLAIAKYSYAISPTDGLGKVAIARNWQVFNGNDTKGIIDSINGNLIL